MDKKDKPDNTEPALPAEPTESTEATEPAEPIDRIDPAEPIDRIEPVEPIDRIDPLEPIERIEPGEPARGESRLVCMIAFSPHGPAGGRTRRPDLPPRPPSGRIRAVEADDIATRARQRELVRRGYDAISWAYRGDDGGSADGSGEDTSRYAGWVGELAALLPQRARVADLGCGAGIPATRELAGHGLQVLGIDFSAVQLSRARQLVPAASLVQADMAALHLTAASLDAVVSLYALIHLPLADQQALFPRIRDWLRPGGYLLAIVGAEQWTGTDEYCGADMFWDHADAGSYLRWLSAARLEPVWHRFIPEGETGHVLVLARAR